MFYQRDGKWGVYPKKIEFKTTHTVYDMEVDGYENNEENTDIVVTDVVLTEEQQKRFELVRDSKDLSMVEIEKYVMNNDILETNSNMTHELNRAKVINEMKKHLQWDSLEQDIIDAMLSDYETWEPTQTYPKDTLVTWGNQLYKVKQFHNSTDEWRPDTTASLYTPIGVSGTVKNYEVRDGSNPYMKGDPVLYGGDIYICILDNTVWSPEEAPNNWKKDVPEGTVDDWVQKTYLFGDKVMYKDKIYQSIFEGHNVWSPEAYPAGWKTV